MTEKHLISKKQRVKKRSIRHEIDLCLNSNNSKYTDFRLLGCLLLEHATILSRKVNDELLMPISRWIDDPQFLKKHAVPLENIPNWAVYKRCQRKREWINDHLKAQRLSQYRAELRKRKEVKKLLKSIVSTRSRSQPIFQTINHSGSIPAIVAPFSKKAQEKEKTIAAFKAAEGLSITVRLPWEVIIASEIKTSKPFHMLKTYYPDNLRKDRISKFIHILMLEKEGVIELQQDTPCGEIVIVCRNQTDKSQITIQDKNGQDYRFCWNELSEKQQSKVINDISTNKILCRSASP